jgi:hypothetical protein
MGATEDTLVDYMNEVNDAFHEHLAASGGEVQILAVRTFANVFFAGVDFFAAYCRRSLDGMTTTTFGTFPSSSLAIRIWPGNLQNEREYGLDFFNKETRNAVNTSDG